MSGTWKWISSSSSTLPLAVTSPMTSHVVLSQQVALVMQMLTGFYSCIVFVVVVVIDIVNVS